MGMDGASSGGDSRGSEAGTTVTPGNGCAAALGIDAGFYTCATQYFVSPTGSDSNSGTSMADALQTIGAATKLALKGGDCVTVADGTYDETVLVSTSGSADTCTGYVVFRAATPGGAKVVSTDAYNGFMVNANYVMVDGFDLQGHEHRERLHGGHQHPRATARSSSTTTSPRCGTSRTTAVARASARSTRTTCGSRGTPSSTTRRGATTATAASTSGRCRPRTRCRASTSSSATTSSYSNVESDIPADLQTDGEGIILDSFDYADPTYGTTPYAQETLVENNVIWGNGGRGIEASGAQPTSHVTDPQQHASSTTTRSSSSTAAPRS